MNKYGPIRGSHKHRSSSYRYSPYEGGQEAAASSSAHSSVTGTNANNNNDWKHVITNKMKFISSIINNLIYDSTLPFVAPTNESNHNTTRSATSSAPSHSQTQSTNLLHQDAKNSHPRKHHMYKHRDTTGKTENERPSHKTLPALNSEPEDDEDEDLRNLYLRDIEQLFADEYASKTQSTPKQKKRASPRKPIQSTPHTQNGRKRPINPSPASNPKSSKRRRVEESPATTARARRSSDCLTNALQGALKRIHQESTELSSPSSRSNKENMNVHDNQHADPPPSRAKLPSPCSPKKSKQATLFKYYQPTNPRKRKYPEFVSELEEESKEDVVREPEIKRVRESTPIFSQETNISRQSNDDEIAEAPAMSYLARVLNERKERYLAVYKKRIGRIYQQYNMKNQEKVDEWIKIYGCSADKLHDLYSRICSKYNLVPCPFYEGQEAESIDEHETETVITRECTPPLQLHHDEILTSEKKGGEEQEHKNPDYSMNITDGKLLDDIKSKSTALPDQDHRKLALWIGNPVDDSARNTKSAKSDDDTASVSTFGTGTRPTLTPRDSSVTSTRSAATVQFTFADNDNTSWSNTNQFNPVQFSQTAFNFDASNFSFTGADDTEMSDTQKNGSNGNNDANGNAPFRFSRPNANNQQMIPNFNQNPFANHNNNQSFVFQPQQHQHAVPPNCFDTNNNNSHFNFTPNNNNTLSAFSNQNNSGPDGQLTWDQFAGGSAKKKRPIYKGKRRNKH